MCVCVCEKKKSGGGEESKGRIRDDIYVKLFLLPDSCLRTSKNSFSSKISPCTVILKA